jgi:hypothetical protein
MKFPILPYLLLLFLFFSGCGKSSTKGTSSDPSQSGEASLSRLRVLEQQQSFGLYELIYSNAGSEKITDVMVAQGQLMMNDQGILRFEQRKKDPQKTVQVYFDPNRIIQVAFPKLKLAYRADPMILAGKYGERVVAIYDGLRILLGLSEIWNHPEKHSIKTGSGGTLLVTQEGRPYRWTIETSGAYSGIPVDSLKAKSGFSEVCFIQRNTASYQQYTEGNKKAFLQGAAGQIQKTFNWNISFPRAYRTTDLVFTPYPLTGMDTKKANEMLVTPELAPEIQTQELSLDMILDWLSLR